MLKSFPYKYHSRFYSQKGLTKGEKYQFRVRAVNKGGISEPSEPTPYTVAKPRRRKHIDILKSSSVITM
jgi:hypothetical protein